SGRSASTIRSPLTACCSRRRCHTCARRAHVNDRTSVPTHEGMTRNLLVLVSLALAVPTASADAPRTASEATTLNKLDRFVTFEPGRRRIYSKSRDQLRLLARTVRATCPAATVTVEGNAY